MQFVVTAPDGDDAGAQGRRMAVRDAHIATTDEYKAKGNMVIGAAILGEAGQMVGSVMIVEFEAREDFDQWLAEEPYVTGDVWRSVVVEECRVGPSFLAQA